MRSTARPLLLVALMVLSLLAACTGASPTAGTSQTTTPAGQPGRVASSAPKILTIAVQRVPTQLFTTLGQPETSVGGATHIFSIPHDLLVVQDSKGNWLPRLAADEISTDAGTWVLNADGSMDTTWKLRPTIKWQDGTPFTSDDLMFTFCVFTDPAIPNSVGAAIGLMDSASAPDAETFAIHWKAPYIYANRAPGLTPLPRHLLGDVFSNDKVNLINSPYTTSQFVGLGPYRLTSWDPGSEIAFSRFDDYYLGRPSLDSVDVKVIGDANALIANILAGGVDVILSEGADLDAEIDLKQRWEGTGNQVYILPYDPGGGLRHFEIQFRPEYAQPTHFGLADHTVRQAFYQATNRQNLSDIITHGYGPVADSWVPPYHTLRPALEAAIPQFPYDPGAAQQLLAQAGWVKGQDGILVHQQTGERFETTLYSSQGANVERAINVAAEDWKAMGAIVDLAVIPIELGSDRQYRATLPGAGYTGGVGYDAFSTDRLHSKFISSPANSWAGSNRGGYNNPQVDALIDRVVVTIDPPAQLDLQRQLLRAQMGDIAMMPLFWDINVVPVVKGVQGLDGGDSNVFHWDKE